jgi:hypothetical protein
VWGEWTVTTWRGLAAAAVTGAAALAAALISATPSAAADAVSVRLRAAADPSEYAHTSYALRVENGTADPIDVAVTLELPSGARVLTASDRGRASGDTVMWWLTVPADAVRSLHSTATTAGRQAAVSTACVAEVGSTRVLDCAAVPDARPSRGAVAAWPWRQIVSYTLVSALAVGVVWAAHRRRRHTHPGTATREPYAWVVFLLAVLALAVPLAVAVAVLAPRMPGASGVGARGVDGGGWTGPHRPLELGVPATDGAVQFTVYRLTCTGTGARTCTAIVALRNVGATPQSWAAQLQRLYTSDTAWVGADPTAGVSANGGADVFKDPIGPRQRLVATLVFPLPSGAAPTRLELREGVFARGVYLPVL